MKLKKTTSPFAPTFWLVALLMTRVLVFLAPAQPAPEDRWLLVFDTSAAMKKKLPAVETAVKSFLSANGNGHLRPGTTVGVWTFDQQLRTGRFPLTVWTPELAEGTISSLVSFIHQQHYAGTTDFGTLPPLLSRVIEDSEHLTLVIFCDGQDEITWTPYKYGINQTFRQNLNERKEARQPFVLVLRTQRGKFIGCTVNFPPTILNVPPFPPLPEQIKSAPPPPPVQVAIKTPPVPALIIIGTNVSTNPADIPKAATNEPVQPSVVPPHPGAHAPPVTAPPASNIVPLYAPAAPVASPPSPQAKPIKHDTPSVTRTNPITAADAGDQGSSGLLVLESGLIIAALALAAFLVVRSRNRGRGSLITSSMNQDRRRR